MTHANPQFDQASFGRSRIVEWRNAAGETLHGSLLLPPDYKQGTRYPLVVFVYGGVQQSRDANRFGMARTPLYNHHLLTQHGYVAFLPDSPPSPGDPIGGLVRNVLPGVDRVVEEGYADSQRIGLAGASYGAYSALALLTRTNRFKAALATAGLYNLTSVYLALDADGSSPGMAMADTGRLFFEGTLWSNRDAFIANSPVFDLDKVATPCCSCTAPRMTRRGTRSPNRSSVACGTWESPSNTYVTRTRDTSSRNWPTRRTTGAASSSGSTVI